MHFFNQKKTNKKTRKQASRTMSNKNNKLRVKEDDNATIILVPWQVADYWKHITNVLQQPIKNCKDIETAIAAILERSSVDIICLATAVVTGTYI